MVCKDLRIAIFSIEFKCNAYVFDFMGYGLILGMDWLASDCERRVVRLSTCLGNTLEISCDPKGSVYLSYLESLDASIDDLQSVRIVHEYANVFNQVRGLSPKT